MPNDIILPQYEYLWWLLCHMYGEEAQLHFDAYVEGNKHWISEHKSGYSAWLGIPSRFADDLEALHIDYLKMWSVTLYIVRVSCFSEPLCPHYELSEFIEFLASSSGSNITATITQADGRKKNRHVKNQETISLLMDIIKRYLSDQVISPAITPLGKEHQTRPQSRRAVIATQLFFNLIDILTERHIIPSKLPTRKKLTLVSHWLYRAGIVESRQYAGIGGDYLKRVLSRYGITRY